MKLIDINDKDSVPDSYIYTQNKNGDVNTVGDELRSQNGVTTNGEPIIIKLVENSDQFLPNIYVFGVSGNNLKDIILQFRLSSDDKFETLVNDKNVVNNQFVYDFDGRNAFEISLTPNSDSSNIKVTLKGCFGATEETKPTTGAPTTTTTPLTSAPPATTSVTEPEEPTTTTEKKEEKETTQVVTEPTEPTESTSPTVFSSSSTTNLVDFDQTTSFITCVYSEWSDWTSCSVSCGEGITYRYRSLLSGFDCELSSLETIACFMPSCTCKFTLSLYLSTFYHYPSNDQEIGYIDIDSIPGKSSTDESIYIDDVLDAGVVIHSENCTKFVCLDDGTFKYSYDVDCQKDCYLHEWSEWSSCPSCIDIFNPVSRFRNRLFTPETNGGKACEGNLTETEACEVPQCACVDGYNCSCVLSEWSDWTACSKPCDLGYQFRERYFISRGLNCSYESLVEYNDCNEQCCPVDGRWSEWNEWSECPVKCNGGVRTRNRVCSNPSPSCDGNPCEGLPEESEPCNMIPCEPECSSDMIFSNCSNACDHTCETLTCFGKCNNPENCEPGCVCPNGTVKDQNGKCVNPEKCLCNYDGKTYQNDEYIYDTPNCKKWKCNSGCLIDQNATCECTWSDWTDWGVCSSVCDGIKSRYRTNSCDGSTESEVLDCGDACFKNCTDPVSGISYESGSIIDYSDCSFRKCQEDGTIITIDILENKVDGDWSTWSDWSNCDQYCNGRRMRFRLCSSPVPQCGGLTCILGKAEHVIVDLNNTAIHKEIESETCNQICSTTTPSLTTPNQTTTEKVTTCSYKNMTFENGETFINPENECEICECVNGEAYCLTSCKETADSCSEKNKEFDSYEWIPPKEGSCCGECKKIDNLCFQPPNLCSLKKLDSDYIKIGNCRSVEKQERDECSGLCSPSKEENGLIMADGVITYRTSCKCCRAAETKNQTITMNCQTDSVNNIWNEQKVTYIRISSCACNECK